MKNRLLIILAAAVVLVAAIVVGRHGSTKQPVRPPATATLPPLTSTYGELYTAMAGESLFGLQSVRYVVASAYLYEANLLDQSTPVADIDYLLPYAAQETVSIPGYATDHYYYEGAVYVTGSGWVEKWITPNGGHFAFLHMSALYVNTAFAPTVTLPTPTPSGPLTASTDGDNHTAEAVGNVGTRPPGIQSGYYTGKSVVGVSGWPLDPYYGNGSYGPADAHLCFLLDARAADWFYAILTGAHKPKPKFPLKAWQHWCRSKAGRKCQSAYSHKRLTWKASEWWAKGRYHKLGGATPKDKWYAPQKGRRYGYDRYAFGHGGLYCWPHYNACKVGR